MAVKQVRLIDKGVPHKKTGVIMAVKQVRLIDRGVPHKKTGVIWWSNR